MELNLLRAIADRTMDCRFTIWGFGVGGALSGLLRAGMVLGSTAYADRVADLVRPSAGASRDSTDHLISIEVLEALRGVLPAAELERLTERWLTAVLDAERPIPQRPQVHRPDLSRWSSTIWVDCMHTDGPGLAASGRPAEATAAATEYAAVLQRADGLFQHGYDVSSGQGNGVAWGRGQGWALLGLLDTHAATGDLQLRARLEHLATALAEHEIGPSDSGSGQWRTVVDDPAAPIENSVSAFVAQGIGQAVRTGILGAEHAAVAERAMAASLAAVHAGGLTVSDATPIGSAPDYHDRSQGVFPWGQGPLLHAVLDRLEGPDQSNVA